MKKTFTLILILLISFSVTCVFGQKQGTIIEGEIIVQLKQSTAKHHFELSATSLGFQIKQELSKRMRIYLIQYDAARFSSEIMLQKVQSMKQVLQKILLQMIRHSTCNGIFIIPDKAVVLLAQTLMLCAHGISAPAA